MSSAVVLVFSESLGGSAGRGVEMVYLPGRKSLAAARALHSAGENWFAHSPQCSTKCFDELNTFWHARHQPGSDPGMTCSLSRT